MNGTPPSRKALPPRPSADLGYRGGQGDFGMPQKGYRNDENANPRSYGIPAQNGQRVRSPEPNGRVVLEGYRNEIMNGFEVPKPPYNPLNPTRPQSSPLLNVNDPIQVHLLVETALFDSKDYEIFSQEEVDDLKKQCQYLTQRIEQTRQNLAIQSKYRDAAISMAKLYSPTDKKKAGESPDSKKSRRSILGHNRQGSDQVREAEQERMASERKCEELAAELFSLEKRLMEPQSKLLRHTAGILQMTHKGPKKTPKGPGNQQQPGIPGSPESMYTYSNARSSMEPIGDEFFFDERSAYKSADKLDGFGDIERESVIGPPPRSQARDQMQIITKTEQKLEALNSRLREVIVKANPQRGASYATPPSKSNPGETLQSHLDYLERSISTIDQEHSLATRKHEESESAMEETLESLNRELRGLLLPYDANQPEPPKLTGKGLNEQLMFFQDIIGAVEVELSRAGANAKNMGNQENLEQLETVMMGLWDIIQSGEEENRQRKQQRRQTRTAQNLPEDEDDMSPDEGGDSNEPFTLQGFSTKVQWLYAQATRLKDQKKVLQRQIKQQRELNSKSDATKDAELAQKVEETERIQALLIRTERDADSVREQLSLVMQKLDDARQQERMREQSRQGDESAAIRAAQEELNEKAKMIAALEEELQDLKDDRSIASAELQGKIADSESKIASLSQELAAAAAAQAAFETAIKAKEKEVSNKEQELENSNMEIARLQTEVTIARAELDGAYGSRAQRAAEVAANPVIQKEIDNLKERNASLTAELATLKQNGSSGSASDEKMRTLKKELEETIEEYEQMTKASIEWEKEREQLESTIDKLRDERESLEAQLSDEKVRWLGMKSPGVDGAAQPGATSTTVLKNEFKKMMRDTRADSAKALRQEQAERRRLEDELRALKKAQGPGKSSLSQSYGSS
ncbi:Up-regulated During Septation domain containing protein [Hyaloscypha variabilis]